MGDAARSGGAGFGDIVHGDAVGELDAFDELGRHCHINFAAENLGGRDL